MTPAEALQFAAMVGVYCGAMVVLFIALERKLRAAFRATAEPPQPHRFIAAVRNSGNEQLLTRLSLVNAYLSHALTPPSFGAAKPPREYRN